MLTDSVSSVEKLDCLVAFFRKGSFANGRGADDVELNEVWRIFGDADDIVPLAENGDASGPPTSSVGSSPSELSWLSSRATKGHRSESLTSEMDRRRERLVFSAVDVPLLLPLTPLVSSDGAASSFVLDGALYERRFGSGCGG